MTITIVATPKAADANSYATENEGDAYHETHLYSTAWDTADAERKKAALVWATRLLDAALEYEGWRTTTEQKLAWPRQGIWTRDNIEVDSDTIPEFMLNSTAELARHLLEEDRSAEPDTKGFSRISVGPISLSIDKLDAKKNPIPESVMELLGDYARVVRSNATVRLVRT